jgi:glycosyl transferase family 25
MILENIYVINLDKSKDRLNNVSDSMRKFNLSFFRFPAIDGYQLNYQELKNRVSTLGRTILSNYGMIGCALSHMQLWNNLKNDMVDYYLIMEDDIILGNDFIDKVNKIEKYKNEIDFDIISLHCLFRTPFDTKKMQYEDLVLVRSPFPLSTTAYIISKRGACKLLSMINKINYHIDVEIALRTIDNKIRYFILDKNIVKLNRTLDSTVQNTGHKSILLTLVKNIFPNTHAYDNLNISVFTICMKYRISTYLIILIILLIINILFFNNIYIYFLIIIEIVLYFM